MANAIGMIEFRSFPAALEASNAMLHTSQIRLLGYEKTGDGLITVLIEGSVQDVQQVIERGVQAAENVGEVVSLSVIPSPHPALLQAPGLVVTNYPAS